MPRRLIAIACTALLLTLTISASASFADDGASQLDPHVILRTSEGEILLRLDRANAPVSVENFLAYVDQGHYSGTIFHRVISNFMIQGGGFDAEFNQKHTRPPIRNEADNGLKNVRGTIAMARTSDPHSATAQFYINTVDNPGLDHRAPTRDGWGYTVFGKVVDGMDIVDRIRNIPTTSGGPFRSDVPSRTVIIESAERIAAPAAPAD
jgi:peptidyl-prolyl cis-trans isomerase B (cyclophilin B)